MLLIIEGISQNVTVIPIIRYFMSTSLCYFIIYVNTIWVKKNVIDKFSRKKLHTKMKRHTSRDNDTDQTNKIITVDKVLSNSQSIEGFMTHLSEGMHLFTHAV